MKSKIKKWLTIEILKQPKNLIIIAVVINTIATTIMFFCNSPLKTGNLDRISEILVNQYFNTIFTLIIGGIYVYLFISSFIKNWKNKGNKIFVVSTLIVFLCFLSLFSLLLIGAEYYNEGQIFWIRLCDTLTFGNIHDGTINNTGYAIFMSYGIISLISFILLNIFVLKEKFKSCLKTCGTILVIYIILLILFWIIVNISIILDTILWLILAIPAIFIFVGKGIGGLIEGIDESNQKSQEEKITKEIIKKYNK